MVLGTCFGLARMKNGGFGVKGIKLGSVTSRPQVTSRQHCLLSRVVNHSRVVNLAISSKSHNFTALSSFRILDIILSTDIQIE